MRRGPSPSPSPPPVSQRSGGQHASSACTEGTRKRRPQAVSLPSQCPTSPRQQTESHHLRCAGRIRERAARVSPRAPQEKKAAAAGRAVVTVVAAEHAAASRPASPPRRQWPIGNTRASHAPRSGEAVPSPLPPPIRQRPSRPHARRACTEGAGRQRPRAEPSLQSLPPSSQGRDSYEQASTAAARAVAKHAARQRCVQRESERGIGRGPYAVAIAVAVTAQAAGEQHCHRVRESERGRGRRPCHCHHHGRRRRAGSGKQANAAAEQAATERAARE